MNNFDPNNPAFDPESLTINQIIQILSKWDVDLPPTRQKKVVYLNLLIENLSYIKKRSKNEAAITLKASKTPVSVTPERRSRDDLEVSTTPVTRSFAGKSNNVSGTLSSDSKLPVAEAQSPDHKQLALKNTSTRSKRVLESSNNSILVNSIKPATPLSSVTRFSDENPFQSPKSKTFAETTFSSSSAKLPDSEGKMDIDFSIKAPVFEGSTTPAEKSVLKSPKRRGSSGKKTFKNPSEPILNSENSKQVQSMTQEPKTNSSYVSKMSLEERILIRSREKSRSKKMSAIISLSLLSMIFLFLAHWVRVDYPLLHYCDPEKVHSSRFYSFIPACTPCPGNAVCSDRTVVGCDGKDMILKNSLFSRFIPAGLLFFPLNQPTCVHDTARLMRESEKTRQVEHLANVLDVLVREFIGKAQCSARRNFPSYIYSPSKSVLGMPIGLAKSDLQRIVGPKWSSAKFDEYYSLLIDYVSKGSGPLGMILEDNSHHRLFTSSNAPIVSYYCLFKKALWKWLVTFSFELISVGLLTIGGVLGYMGYQRRNFELLVYASLLEDIVVAVHAETENYHQDPKRHPTPSLSISQLKDHFLPRSVPIVPVEAQVSPGSSKTTPPPNADFGFDSQGRRVWFVSEPGRSRIWKKVCKAVTKNANIRETSAPIKGESHTVWEISCRICRKSIFLNKPPSECSLTLTLHWGFGGSAAATALSVIPHSIVIPKSDPSWHFSNSVYAVLSNHLSSGLMSGQNREQASLLRMSMLLACTIQRTVALGVPVSDYRKYQSQIEQDREAEVAAKFQWIEETFGIGSVATAKSQINSILHYDLEYLKLFHHLLSTHPP